MQKLNVEKRTIAAMMRIYCKDQHQNPDSLCDECANLLGYAFRRIDNCPFKANKPACNTCTVHCYNMEKREKVRQVMRYSGPKMPLRHPFLSIAHLARTWREGRKKDQ